MAGTFLHLANGTSTTRPFTPPASRVDPRSGPIRSTRGRCRETCRTTSCSAIRARHLADERARAASAIAVARCGAGATSSTTTIAYDELVLWFEHDLFDQLNLIQVLEPSRGSRSAGRSRSALICIGSFPGRPRFKGLGELTARRAGAAVRRPASRSPPRSTRWRPTPGPRSAPPTPRRSRRCSAPTPPRCRTWPRRSTATSRSSRRRPTACPAPSAGCWSSRHGRAIPLRDSASRMHDEETAFYIADTSFLHVARLASPLARWHGIHAGRRRTLAVSTALTGSGVEPDARRCDRSLA